jgi:cellulose synthase/poly-beta-1,6-N-acetylglucosamine synthase-like glycosyltransferase
MGGVGCVEQVTTSQSEMTITSRTPVAEVAEIATLSIVVPTFNEVENVAVLVEKIGTVLAGEAWDLVFIDNDSTDGTETALYDLCRKYPNIRMIRRIGRRGLLSAVVEAILSTSSPYVALMDAYSMMSGCCRACWPACARMKPISLSARAISNGAAPATGSGVAFA